MSGSAGWLLRYDGFVPAEEGVREALCTLGNGYFATRGAGPETSADDVHYPGTYAAGLYNRLETRLGERDIVNEDLVNLPNWLCLNIRPADGDWFNLQAVDLVDYRQELDLKQGVLTRRIHFRDRGSRETRIEYRQFVHMGAKHLAAVQLTVEPVNWTGRVVARSALDGRVTNSGVARYREFNSRHLEALETGVDEETGLFLRVRTSQSRIEVAQGARLRLFVNGAALDGERTATEEAGYASEEISFELQRGDKARLEKIVAFYTSRDRAISECGSAVREQMRRAPGFQDLLRTHTHAWASLWRRCDIELVPDAKSQLILRLHLFHLLQTVSPNSIDLDVGVPARGLHGEAYRGHIFWDELFVLPLLTMRLPDVTRSMLLYRFRRLNEARWNARKAGFSGAMYPWQSGSDGQEEAQVVHLNPRSGRWIADNSNLQRHVNSAIVYNIWFYVQATRDRDFLTYYGAEMILEIARFWASASVFDEEIGRYEIRGVMGPDEYHERYPDSDEPGIDNNAYTNVMAAWVFWRARDVLNMLDEERRSALCERLGITAEEISSWDEMSRKMRLFISEDGIISQFEGYDELAELDWERYRQKYGNIQRLDRILEAEGDDPNRYKLSKQADVLMLFFLFSAQELKQIFQRLGYDLDPQMMRDNVEYYMPRTAHGSTLSRVVDSWLLARVDRKRSWDVFLEALNSDFGDIQEGTTAEGIHLGAMAGTVDIVQRCYTGLEARDEALFFHPNLPKRLTAIRQRFRYRGHWLDVHVSQAELVIKAGESKAAPISIGFNGALHTLKSGGELRLEFLSKE